MPDTYPQATWDVPNALLNYAGGFWRDTYTGQQELRAYFAGVSRICAQHDVQVVELLDSMSRHSVKNTRQFLLSPIVLRKSALASLYLQFGQTAEFAQQSTYTFGGLGPTRYAFPAPAGWCSLRSLQQGLQQLVHTLPCAGPALGGLLSPLSYAHAGLFFMARHMQEDHTA